ncbi:hypothetical protein NDU88_005532 [Pleurodeles waltl]|uniref:Uncharacterized protein n=1 Tax=Pleurodeles waltl TaxID=8319 RepID=A0AAV7LCP8_PLEWA|nr:hypothetical protein NDU88_005532 [Pleurodeles waltl]
MPAPGGSLKELYPCDERPVLPDQSVKAACAAAATGNPELEGGIASHPGVPRLKRAADEEENAEQEERRAADEEENAEQEERRAADKEENPEDVGLWEGEDGRKRGPLVKSQDTSEGEDVIGTLTAAQEAHCKDSGHASGEAWHSQVRP